MSMLNANSQKCTWSRCTYHFGKCIACNFRQKPFNNSRLCACWRDDYAPGSGRPNALWIPGPGGPDPGPAKLPGPARRAMPLALVMCALSHSACCYVYCAFGETLVDFHSGPHHRQQTVVMQTMEISGNVKTDIKNSPYESYIIEVLPKCTCIVRKFIPPNCATCMQLFQTLHSV